MAKHLQSADERRPRTKPACCRWLSLFSIGVNQRHLCITFPYFEFAWRLESGLIDFRDWWLNAFQQALSALGTEQLSDAPAELIRIIVRPTQRGKNSLTTVRVEDGDIKAEGAVVKVAGPGSERDHATALKLGKSSAFGKYGAACWWIIEGSDDCSRCRIVGTAFNPECSLPNSGKEQGRTEPLRDMMLETEPAQAGQRQNHSVEFSHQRLIETRLDVAAKVGHVEIGPNAEKLGPSAERAGSDGCSCRKGFESTVDGSDEGIRSLLARGNRCQDQLVRASGWQVLEAVNGNVDGGLEQRALDFLREETKTADRGEWRVPVTVSLRLDLDEDNLETRTQRPECSGDPLCLPARQGTAARPDSDHAWLFTRIGRAR
jgi:hypothetical protein